MRPERGDSAEPTLVEKDYTGKVIRDNHKTP